MRMYKDLILFTGIGDSASADETGLGALQYRVKTQRVDKRCRKPGWHRRILYGKHGLLRIRLTTRCVVTLYVINSRQLHLGSARLDE